MIDVTNTAAVQWFGERLRRFGAEFGVDSFQFDAGEVDYLPPRWRTAVPLSNVNYYTMLYVHMAASFGRMVEVTRLATHYISSVHCILGDTRIRPIYYAPAPTGTGH